jgi:hypothetical protein
MILVPITVRLSSNPAPSTERRSTKKVKKKLFKKANMEEDPVPPLQAEARWTKNDS